VGEGTGLGLSTVYGIVKQSGGYIFVDSEPGRGTVFELYFPVHEAPMAVEPPRVEEPAPKMLMRKGEGVVLLVEDEAPVRAFASRALRMRGYTVLEAENAEEALRTLEDPGLEVDVFVTDVVMPGMDGPSWVKRALETRPNVRVVFVSGYAEDVLSADQARIPNSVFLPKPFSLNELTATVQGQLH
jgi:two-component system cell cycle sensor histidine kinase/response regulator CckA